MSKIAKISVFVLLIVLFLTTSNITYAREPFPTDDTTYHSIVPQSIQVDQNSPNEQGITRIYHVTGWLYTSEQNVHVILEKYQDGNWWYMYSRTYSGTHVFGFYDLEYGLYRVRTWRGFWRYCQPTMFYAGHSSNGNDYRVSVTCYR